MWQERTNMSIFTMEDVNSVITMSKADAAIYVKEIINKNESAKAVTKKKALHQVMKNPNPERMAYAMTCWLLAHPDEGLKVIK
jgi:hypothetical protein